MLILYFNTKSNKKMEAGTGEDSTYDQYIKGLEFQEEQDKENHNFILNSDSNNLSEKNSISQKSVILKEYKEENYLKLVKYFFKSS